VAPVNWPPAQDEFVAKRADGRRSSLFVQSKHMSAFLLMRKLYPGELMDRLTGLAQHLDHDMMPMARSYSAV
jgi:hypothetical protein